MLSLFPLSSNAIATRSRLFIICRISDGKIFFSQETRTFRRVIHTRAYPRNTSNYTSIERERETHRAVDIFSFPPIDFSQVQTRACTGANFASFDILEDNNIPGNFLNGRKQFRSVRRSAGPTGLLLIIANEAIRGLYRSHRCSLKERFDKNGGREEERSRGNARNDWKALPDVVGTVAPEERAADNGGRERRRF